MRRPTYGLLLLSATLGCSGSVRETQARGSTGSPAGEPSATSGRGPVDPSAQAGSSGSAAGNGAPPDIGMQAGDPGRVTLHRLNRAEYANTVRDLLGTTLRPSDDFPTDDRGYGYDNIADVLSLSPLQIELYFNAAEALVAEALTVAQTGARRYEAEAMQASTGAAHRGTAFNLNSAGNLQQSVPIATAGQYRIAARAFGQQAGTEPARMTIDVDGRAIETVDVTAVESTPATYEAMVELEAGNAIIGVSFLNDYYVAEPRADRNLVVDWVEIEGPLGVASDNPLRAKVLVCEPDAAAPEPCLREIGETFGRRAFRRPLTDAELDRLVTLPRAALAAGDDTESATRLLLRAILISPNFLFRVEVDPDPSSAAPHALTDHELAARLSYFLWSSMPDPMLDAVADRGQLQDPAVLREQVARMLQDEKAEALLDNFAGQWLFIRALDDHVPDYAAYPDFDEGLRVAMRKESELYVREFLFGQETLDRLLTADFSFVNGRLAEHYGLPGAAAMGDEFQRVSLRGTPRAGLLTQGGLLTVTSYPARTSPVKRGKWVLEQLLCSGPPPPPPGVEGLMPEAMPTGSLRERMEAHRSNPICASCHTSMDPIGFGFENYDGIGAHREDDQGFAIDASGMLPSGQSFNGPIELATLLAGDTRLPHCMAQQLFTYALGRGIEPIDGDDLMAVTESFVSSGYRFRDLAAAIAISPAFRMRRGETAEESQP